MASTRLMTRTLLTTAKQTLIHNSPRSLSTPPPSSLFRLRLRPLSTLPSHFNTPLSPSATIRGFATRPSTSSLNDPNPNWSNRPPKETILLDGCDFEHWLIVVEKPDGDPTRDEIIDSYIKTLANVVGSEEEARMKIYSVSTRHYFAFGALVSEELSYKLKELPGVRWVLPDSYLDVKNKDYGGEPFINGQAVPYDPKYHEEWVRNNARANERNRRNDRPRNFDRSRNFERRNVQSNQNSPNPGYNNAGPQGNNGPNMAVGPQGNMPPNMVGGPQGNMGPNMPRGPQGNMGPTMVGGPQGNMGPNMNGGQQGNMAPNMVGGPPPNMGPNISRGPQGNMVPNMGGPGNAGQQHPGQNFAGGPPAGGIPPQFGGVQSNNIGNPPNYNAGPNTGLFPNNQQNSNYVNGQSNGAAPYQSGPNPNPNQNFVPNSGNPYQSQNMPGRDY